MLKHQIAAGCVGLLALALFLAGLLLPVAIVGLPNGGTAISLWESLWFRGALLVFIVFVALPLFRPGRRIWIASLFAAGVVMAVPVWALLQHFVSPDSSVPLTLFVLVFAGILLAVEAMLVRRFHALTTRSSELPSAGAAGSRSP